MIDSELLYKAGIDYEAGMKRFMQDTELYEAVLTAFIGEDILERAQAAFDADDTEHLLKVIHEAKGSGGNAGLDQVYTEACALGTRLRSESYTYDELAEDFNRFKSAYLTASNGIKAALGQ